MDDEKWKPVKDYEGIYEISDLGNIKSLSREIYNGHNIYISKERALKPGINGNGYLNYNLHKNGIRTNKTIHQIVAIAFLNHEPNKHRLVVDHINGNKLDNKVTNLQIVTNRENTTICFKKTSRNLTSKFIGVSKVKNYNKWHARICIDGKLKHIGYFDSEQNASNAYQEILKSICCE